MKDDIINAGANYVDQPAVVDKNIVTTAHYKDMGPWMASVIKLLKIMNEYNLLDEYPKLEKPRFVSSDQRTIHHRLIASKREKDFLMEIEIMDMVDLSMMADGKIAEKVIKRYNLKDGSKVLQINCEMGFFLHDLKSINPNINVYGLETSKYAFNNTINDTIKKCFKCKKL